MTDQRWAIVSDIHSPWHDKRLLPKVLKAIHNESPYGIIINGDLLDNYSIASHNQDSVHKLKDVTLDWEYKEANKVLDSIDQALPKGARRVFIFGNHEDRYFRELERGDRGKYGGALLHPTDALRLRERGYLVKENWKQDYHPLGSHLEVTHGVYCPVHAAKKHLDEFQGSVIIGHTHRYQTYVSGKRGAWNFGFLGDLNSEGFHYTPRTNRGKWVQSFGFVTIDDRGRHYVEPVQCYDGRFIYKGDLY